MLGWVCGEGGYGLQRREGKVVVQVQKREGREGVRVAEEIREGGFGGDGGTKFLFLFLCFCIF